jgi:PTS system mannitol-specific IIC component
MIFDSGLRAPAAPGSIIAVWLQAPASSFVGVTLSVILAATVTFLIASVILKADRSEEVDDLAAATARMEENKGKKSSVAGALTGAGAGPPHAIQASGHSEVTVVNKAISNLQDDVDLVVTHQDLTARAQQRTPSAIHVSVDNFMGSPRYDEIVEMVEQANGGGASDPKADAPSGGADAEVLAPSSIVLNGTASSRDAAIEEAGQLLVAAGAVDASYVSAMHDREASVSTFMGNGLAIPHGTNEAKGAIRRTAISFVRYDTPVDWNGKPAEFVLGIAGAGDDHLALLSRIAEVFTNKDRVAELRAASSPQQVLDVLQGVQV